MRLLKSLLFLIVLFISSSSIITRDEADAAIEEIESIGETEDPKLLDRKAILSNSLALFYQSIDDNKQAVLFIQKAIKHTEKRIRLKGNMEAQDLDDLQDLYLNLAKVNGTAGYIDEAEIAYLKAKEYFDKLKPLVDAASYNNESVHFYGTAFAWAFHSNDYKRAETFGILCLDASEQTENPTSIAESNRRLGELHNKMGDMKKALNYFDAAIHVLRKNDPDAVLAQNLIRSKIGILYMSKRYKEVISFMKNESLFSSKEQLHDRIQDIPVVEYAGVLENAFILSYAYIREYQETKNLPYLDQAQSWQSSAYQLAEFAMFENGIDRLGQVISAPDQKITSTLKNYELLEQEGALSQEEISQLLRTIDVYHSSQLNVNRLKNEINGENWNKQKELRVQLEAIFNQIQEAETNDPKLDSLQNLSLKVSTKIARLSVSTKRQEIAKEYQLGQQDFSRRIDQFSKSTKKTIVTYFWSQRLSRLFIIGRNPKRYFFKTVIVDDQFMPAINASYQLNAQFLTEKEALKRQDSLNQTLYELLITPIKKELTTDQLLVYPIGPMSYVSMDALRPNASSYLIEGYTTSYTSSLFALLRQQKSGHGNGRASTFYPSNYGNDSLAELFHAKHEIATIDSFTSIQKYEGALATKEQFLKQNLKTDIIHVASHSILDSENPFDSYLIFEERHSSSAYKLKASEIFTRTFNAELVVLSSCNSAKGNFGGEIGIISLSNAFYFSGVPSTLGSLWSAQDNSSSKIISDFYRNLSENNTKSVSLSLAKKKYLSQADAIKQQPFFWANYVLYGADSPVKMQKESTDWKYYFTAALVLMLIPFLIYKRSRRSLA